MRSDLVFCHPNHGSSAFASQREQRQLLSFPANLDSSPITSFASQVTTFLWPGLVSIEDSQLVFSFHSVSRAGSTAGFLLL